MAGLFAMAALGGTDKSTDGIAAKIRREAEQAFNERMTKDAQAFQTSERVAGQEYASGENEKGREFQTSERIAGQEFTSGEGLINRQHQTNERIAGQTHAEGLLDRKLDHENDSREDGQSHDHELLDKRLDGELKAVIAKSGSKGNKTLEGAYKLLIQTKTDQLNKAREMDPDLEDEGNQMLAKELGELEKRYKQFSGVSNGSPAPTMTKEQVINAAMSKYPEQSRDTIIEKLKQDKKYGHLFEDESPMVAPKASNGTGLINSVSPKTSVVG